MLHNYSVDLAASSRTTTGYPASFQTTHQQTSHTNTHAHTNVLIHRREPPRRDVTEEAAPEAATGDQDTLVSSVRSLCDLQERGPRTHPKEVIRTKDRPSHLLLQLTSHRPPFLLFSILSADCVPRTAPGTKGAAQTCQPWPLLPGAQQLAGRKVYAHNTAE